MSRDLINAALTTLVAETVTLPVCAIKTNYQNTDGSITKTVYRLYEAHGLRAFYRASIPAIASQVFSTSSKYYLYQMLNRLDEKPRHLERIRNGSVAGIISSLATHPIDVIKVFWQMGTSLGMELKHKGPTLLYRGYTKTLGKIGISSAMFYPLYDGLKEHCPQTQIGAMMASGGSAIISTIVMQPLDYAKTRQIYGLGVIGQTGYISCFRGLSLNLTRVVPHFMITMTAINWLESRDMQM